MYSLVDNYGAKTKEGEGWVMIKSQIGACKGLSQMLLWDQKRQHRLLFLKSNEENQVLTIDNRAVSVENPCQKPNWLTINKNFINGTCPTDK